MGAAAAHRSAGLPRRDAGRVILVDGAARVLLFRTATAGPDGVRRER